MLLGQGSGAIPCCRERSVIGCTHNMVTGFFLVCIPRSACGPSRIQQQSTSVFA